MRPFRGNIISGALSAIDIALWDIKGKHFGAPVWELLGGKYRDKVRLHLLLNGGNPDEIRTNAKIAAEEGFTALKFDPLQAGYQDQSLARVIEGVRDMGAAAREAVGLDVDLIFELHRKLSPMHGVAVAEALAEFRPLFIEDPIQIDSIMLQGELAKRFTFPLANGERINTIWEARDLLAAGGPQYVRPDLGVAGGLTGCRKIAAIAESYHSALVSHNFQGPLDHGRGHPPRREHPQLRDAGVPPARRVAASGRCRLQDRLQARGRLHPGTGGARPWRRAG